MRIVMFYHSLVCDWNHGNAHFLRGVVAELLARGHDVVVYEPRNGWSVSNLVSEHGREPIREFRNKFPHLRSMVYYEPQLDLEAALSDADLVIVHEWNDHRLVKRIGDYRKRVGGFYLLFHDTHHRCVTDFDSIAAYDLSNYDGVLAFGRIIRDVYLAEGIADRAWVWHEAADTRIFKPLPVPEKQGDLVWIGNWGDDERTGELYEYLINPVRELGIRATVHGVRYPQDAVRALANSGMEYRGWIANYEVPAAFARHLFTVHVPRRPYVKALPGIPTIRPFEAMACGIPLISAPWDDCEKLFTPGEDYLVATDGRQMRLLMQLMANDADLRKCLAAHARETILARHTCAHRVNELMDIVAELDESRTGRREAIA